MYDVSSSSALSGSTRPAPNCGLIPRGPRCLAVLTRIARISSGVRDGLRAISNAATPLTLAVATEVPVVKLQGPVRRWHQNIHARRRCGDVFPLVGALEQAIAFIGCGDGHNVRISARIKWR